MAEEDQGTIPQKAKYPQYNLLGALAPVDQQDIAASQNDEGPGDDPDDAKQKQKTRKHEEAIQISLPSAEKMEEWAAIRRHPESLTASSIIGAINKLFGGDSDTSNLWVMLSVRPDLGGDALKEAKRGLQSTDPYVRACALEVVSTVGLKAPEFAPEALDLAKTALNDSKVRAAAVTAVADSAYHRDNLAVTAFDLIKPATTDSDPGVRAVTYTKMGELVRGEPGQPRRDLALAAWDSVKVGVNDSYDGAREAAYETIGETVKCHPELGDAALRLVERGMANTGPRTRLGAIDALTQIVQVRPDLADTALKLATVSSRDPDALVRLDTQHTFGAIAATRADLADAVLPFAVKAAQSDPDKLVREVAQKETLQTGSLEKRQRLNLWMTSPFAP